ncbi:iron complex transport system substrate-binding protein [Pseudorhizobium tarimense]|uniref:Iron complex transport system substrate-binding protein n=1 Tax=Pseudorhizobium tarimense TaxID=1079109 RepID=A0ABV2H7V6_9HYPH|nr:ABC transporter substrate-binding protein [Pseudorhizobium tarimense]MCJ8519644.1 ABC transporter substrate-binding protein [Pseudorhizobium tarimense]
MFRSIFPRIVVAFTLTAAAFAAAPAGASEAGNPAAQRIVSVGGTITEILYALGAHDRLVAVDSTSFYPSEATSKPDVGYMRQLSAEGILAQKPDLILAEDGSGPPPVLDILRASGVPMVLVPTPATAEGIQDKIRNVGDAVGLAKEAEALAAKTGADLERITEEVAKLDVAKKRVLFVLSLSNGRIIASGTGTEAAAIIDMAGGINAASGVSGYKPLTDEAVIAAKPDVILAMARGDHKLTPEQVFAVPALQGSPAAADHSLISMDGLFLLGFGPRTPEAVRALATQLYPGGIGG